VKESGSILNTLDGKPNIKKENSLREVGDGNYLLKVTISGETAQLLKKIQGLIAHKKKIDANNLEEVIKLMGELSIDELEPPPPPNPSRKTKSTSVNTSENMTKKQSARYMEMIERLVPSGKPSHSCQISLPKTESAIGA